MSTVAGIPSLPPSRARRFLRHGAVRGLLAFVLVLLAALAPMALLHSVVPKPWRPLWPEFIAAACALLAYRWYIRRTEQREAGEISTRRMGPELAAGLALGFVLVGAVIAVLGAMGAYHLERMNPWSFAIVKPLGEMVFVGVLEELLFRAVLFRMMERAWGTRTSLVLTSLLFGVAHIPGDPTVLAFAATVVAGVMLTAAYMATRRLWLSIGVHIGWNYTLGTIWSIAVSGHEAREGLLAGQLNGPQWLTGGAYGLEGSALTVIVLAVVSAALLLRAARQPG